MVSRERERPREVEKDTEVQRDRQKSKAGHGREERKRREETRRMVEKRSRGETRASHSVSAHKVSGMGGRGERVSGISSGSVMAQCRVMGRGVRRVRAGFPPGAEMSEVTWGRFVGGKGQEEGVRRREEERKALLGIYCRE